MLFKMASESLPSCSTAVIAPLWLGIFGALIIIGGGLFFPPPTGALAAATIGTGAWRVGTGSWSLAVVGADSAPSCSPLKFLFLRIFGIGAAAIPE
jgi:hypothetical protein